MEASRDGLWDWDIQSGNVYYIPGYSTMLGFVAGELEPSVESWLDLIHPDDREKALRANQDCIDGRCENFEVEFRMRTRSGDWKWIVGRGKATARDAQGIATRLVGTHVDITERKLMEESIGREKETLHAIMENTNAHLAYLDPQFNFISQSL